MTIDKPKPILNGHTLASFGALLPASGRLLGLDVGEKRVGVAVSDSGRKVALPRAPLPRVWAELSLGIKALNAQQPVVGVVVGAPLSLAGQRTPQVQGTSDVTDLIGKMLDVPVLLWDERLTSAAAEKSFFEQRDGRQTRASKKASVGHIDSPAAALLLASCLDALADYQADLVQQIDENPDHA